MIGRPSWEKVRARVIKLRDKAAGGKIINQIERDEAWDGIKKTRGYICPLKTAWLDRNMDEIEIYFANQNPQEVARATQEMILAKESTFFRRMIRAMTKFISKVRQ